MLLRRRIPVQPAFFGDISRRRRGPSSTSRERRHRPNSTTDAAVVPIRHLEKDVAVPTRHQTSPSQLDSSRKTPPSHIRHKTCIRRLHPNSASQEDVATPIRNLEKTSPPQFEIPRSRRHIPIRQLETTRHPNSTARDDAIPIRQLETTCGRPPGPPPRWSPGVVTWSMVSANARTHAGGIICAAVPVIWPTLPRRNPPAPPRVVGSRTPLRLL